MDRRLEVKQFIDMDELSMPWESNNKLITPLCNAKINISKNIVEYIKNVKYEYEENNEKGLKLVKKK